MKVIHNKSKAMLLIENNKKQNIEELLRIMYVDQNMNIHDICRELNISYVTALKWLGQAGIYSRMLTSLF
ncbi:MAG: DUF1492 domain-containing protein [Tissierellia bacterium]|nr:DUF1492 domain-containing protein [Tissierellia bacterium]